LEEGNNEALWIEGLGDENFKEWRERHVKEAEGFKAEMDIAKGQIIILAPAFLDAYDALGKEVNILSNGWVTSGTENVKLDVLLLGVMKDSLLVEHHDLSIRFGAIVDAINRLEGSGEAARDKLQDKEEENTDDQTERLKSTVSYDELAKLIARYKELTTEHTVDTKEKEGDQNTADTDEEVTLNTVDTDEEVTLNDQTERLENTVDTDVDRYIEEDPEQRTKGSSDDDSSISATPDPGKEDSGTVDTKEKPLPFLPESVDTKVPEPSTGTVSYDETPAPTRRKRFKKFFPKHRDWKKFTASVSKAAKSCSSFLSSSCCSTET